MAGMSGSLSVQSLRDPLGGVASLQPYGAERVRSLHLRQRSASSLPKTRSTRGVHTPKDPMDDADVTASTDDNAALDSEYATM
eukprot:COSAG02_NODE_17503_length_999_cov_1.065556_1_plen_83_part_00